MSLKALPRVPIPSYTRDQRNLQTTLDTLVKNINRLAADAQTIDKRITETARAVATDVSGEKIYSVPPGPSNLQATGLFQTVVLSWSAGSVDGFAYTEIWRSATDNRGTATLRGTSRSMVFSDSAQEGQTYYYWVRHVNLNSVAGPWNAANGVSATTNISAATVLAAIEGGLTEIHLASALAGRIDLIDTPTTGILARLGVTEDDLYNPTTGIFALHDSLSDVVTDPLTGLNTRASQTDLDSLSATVTDPVTGLTARALQVDFLALETDVEGKASLTAFNSLEADVYHVTTGLSTRASQSDLTSLSTTVDGKAEASTVNQLAIDVGALDTELSGTVTQVSNIQADIDNILAEWSVQVVTDTASGSIISGISLMSDGTQSTFQVLADNFALWDPGPNYDINNADKELVIGYFGGQLGIDGAYMRTATIDNAAVISLAVEKLVAGTLTAGTWIKGGDYYGAQLRLGVGTIVRPDENGVNAGYSSVIDANGDAYFENAYVRGNVEATSVVVGAVDYNDVGGTKPAANADNTQTAIDATIVLTEGGIRAGKTDANDATAGFFLGFDGTTPKLRVGNAASELHWNGSTLKVRGDVEATSVKANTVTTDQLVLSSASINGSATLSHFGQTTIWEYKTYTKTGLDSQGALGANTILTLYYEFSSSEDGKVQIRAYNGSWTGWEDIEPEQFNGVSTGKKTDYYFLPANSSQVQIRMGYRDTNATSFSAELIFGFVVHKR